MVATSVKYKLHIRVKQQIMINCSFSMHRFNNPTISNNFDAARTLSKQTVTLNLNNIVTASKPNRTLTEHSSSYLHLLYSLYVAHDVTFCHNNE